MSISITPVYWRDLCSADRHDLLARPAQRDDAKVVAVVDQIVREVRAQGDLALRRFTRQFDGVDIDTLAVPAAELAAARSALPAGVADALAVAAANIEKFHRAQLPVAQRVETRPGVVCERLVHPLDAVGLYVPGGSAPLPSTVLMLAIPARLAGCPLRVLCTPPGPDGRVAPVVLAAAHLCGVDQVFRVGGAQAIAALAFGTGSIPRVSRIFGPGNRYVTCAKTRVAAAPDGAAVDMPAGPSELLVIADESAEAEFVAADLLSQAEHGADSQVVLLTTSMDLATAVADELDRQAAQASRRDIIQRALAACALVVVADLATALAISNDYAPEHLILNVRTPRDLLDGVRNAGSVFLGPWTPESLGDYCSGTNHVLPTYGWARAYSGLAVGDFCRTMSVQECSAEGLRDIGPVARRLAEVEGLDAHARAVTVRLARHTREDVA